MKQYFEDHVRSESEPDFSVWKFNRANILKFPGKPRRPEAPADDDLLVNVFDLGGPKEVYLRAAGWKRADPADRRSIVAGHDEPGQDVDWDSLFEGLDEPDKSPEEWLDEKLEFDPKATPGPLVATGAQKDFVKALLQVLKVNRSGWAGGRPRPYQPTWVVRWNEFRKATEWSPGEVGDARSWLEVTGVSRENAGRWLILLVYPVRAVRVLARPTSLDTDWSPYHFPSPPCAPPSVGGHPVDLGQNYRTGRPIAEFIHTQVDLDLTYWANSGYAIGRTTGKIGVDLPAERGFHRFQLQEWYADALPTGWMINPC